MLVHQFFSLLQPEMPTDGVETAQCDRPLTLSSFSYGSRWKCHVCLCDSSSGCIGPMIGETGS